MKENICLCIIILLLLAKVGLAQGDSSEAKTPTERLIEAIEYGENLQFDVALNKLNNILKEAEESNDVDIIIQSNLNIGLLYYRLSEYEKALNYMFIAQDIAKQNNRKNLLTSIYNNISIIYTLNHKTDDAKRFINKSLQLNRENNDSSRIAMNFINLANIESNEKNNDSAIYYLHAAKEIILALEDETNLAAVYNNLGNIYQDQKKYFIAKINYLQAYRLWEEDENNAYISAYSGNLSNVYFELQQFDSSLYFANINIEASKYTKDIGSLINGCLNKAKIFKQKKEYDSSLVYYNKCLSWKDSLLVQRSRKWISEMHMKYEFGKKEKEIEFLAKRNSLYQLLWIISVSAIIIVSGLLLYSTRVYIINLKQKNQILNNEKRVKVLKLEKSEAENRCLQEEIIANQEISELKQKRLKQEIEHKNRELASNALHLVNKNEILQKINGLLSEMNVEDGELSLKKQREIERLIKTNVNLDEEWETFKLHFEEVHGDFFNKINADYPSLSQNDLRLCAYLLINLNPKEIARIFSISPDSVRKRKQRLREKLHVEKGLDLLEFLNKYKM